MRKHRIGKVIAVIIVAICAAWLLVTYVAEPLIDNRELTPIRQLHTQLQKDETASSTGGGTSNKETGGDKSLSSLGIQNLVGWISISGTQVDYPVVQSTKDDPDFYLHHNIWGRSSTAGSIYLNANTSIDRNYLPIYGHHMNNGSMFGALVKYQTLDFARQHPIINFESIKGGESRYKLAAVFTEAQNDPLHVNVVEPLVEETFTAQWQMLSEYSWYCAADVQYGDRLIVLCTCSYSHKNERTVVVARQMRAGESETVSITKNPEAKSPW